MTRIEDAAAALGAADGSGRDWRLLRVAIADALLERLPALVPLARLPELLGVPAKTIARARDSGDLSAVTIGGVPHMVTADSFGFLSGDSYLRWPLPGLSRAGVEVSAGEAFPEAEQAPSLAENPAARGAEPVLLDSERALRASRDADWRRLRAAIADELVQRLPPTVPLARIPELLRIAAPSVADAVRDGAIAVVVAAGVECMLTAESRQFLEDVPLPLPQRLDPRRRSAPALPREH